MCWPVTLSVFTGVCVVGLSVFTVLLVCCWPVGVHTVLLVCVVGLSVFILSYWCVLLACWCSHCHTDVCCWPVSVQSNWCVCWPVSVHTVLLVYVLLACLFTLSYWCVCVGLLVFTLPYWCVNVCWRPVVVHTVLLVCVVLACSHCPTGV